MIMSAAIICIKIRNKKPRDCSVGLSASPVLFRGLLMTFCNLFRKSDRDKFEPSS